MLAYIVKSTAEMVGDPPPMSTKSDVKIALRGDMDPIRAAKRVSRQSRKFRASLENSPAPTKQAQDRAKPKIPNSASRRPPVRRMKAM